MELLNIPTTFFALFSFIMVSVLALLGWLVRNVSRALDKVTESIATLASAGVAQVELSRAVLVEAREASKFSRDMSATILREAREEVMEQIIMRAETRAEIKAERKEKEKENGTPAT